MSRNYIHDKQTIQIRPFLLVPLIWGHVILESCQNPNEGPRNYKLTLHGLRVTLDCNTSVIIIQPKKYYLTLVTSEWIGFSCIFLYREVHLQNVNSFNRNTLLSASLSPSPSPSPGLAPPGCSGPDGIHRSHWCLSTATNLCTRTKEQSKSDLAGFVVSLFCQGLHYPFSAKTRVFFFTCIQVM